jgi:hypothetical protein
VRGAAADCGVARQGAHDATAEVRVAEEGVRVATEGPSIVWPAVVGARPGVVGRLLTLKA